MHQPVPEICPHCRKKNAHLIWDAVTKCEWDTYQRREREEREAEAAELAWARAAMEQVTLTVDAQTLHGLRDSAIKAITAGYMPALLVAMQAYSECAARGLLARKTPEARNAWNTFVESGFSVIAEASMPTAALDVTPR